ncbi:hypothetical protein PsYK624_010270 [Phanerochaete sordida]|uniref:Uncharacterized protein n=1 Tax=Phanerochaete sordida TaxID=48140 RepID=A0A9P3FYI7_9APHY|nr:hypothetical protein PsYK624_010270 [Phanerochaete sordida]
MVHNGPRRLNRLPQRLDYTLIPAPLDLSLPLVDEKAALPAIIVTPSSPSGETDFSIAFIAPPPTPSLKERVSSWWSTLPKISSLQPRLPSQIQLPSTPYKTEFESAPSWTLKTRASTTILMAILVFIIGCHLLLHSLASFHPRMDYGTAAEDSIVAAVFTGDVDNISGVHRSPSDAETPVFGGAFNLHSLWAPGHSFDGKRSGHARFVISEPKEPKLETAPPATV